MKQTHTLSKNQYLMIKGSLKVVATFATIKVDDLL